MPFVPARTHRYDAKVTWTGNRGAGTIGYTAYGREYRVSIDHKPDILGSSDAAFRGDATRHNPEELLIASLSACHMLWFLHLCAEADVVVTSYVDEAVGAMEEHEKGGGQFVEVSLHPVVTVSERWMLDQATELHMKAHEHCFIANSVNFPVRHFPVTKSISE